MKKINIYPIISSLHNDEFIQKEREKLLNKLKELTNFEFNITSLENLYDGDLALILVESGGSENYFLKALNVLKEPYYLLTYGHNNSLAASLEILTFIQRNNKKGEILHGDDLYIANRLIELVKEGNKNA